MVQHQSSILTPLPVDCTIMQRWVLLIKGALFCNNRGQYHLPLTRVKCDIVWDTVSGWGMGINRVVRIIHRPTDINGSTGKKYCSCLVQSGNKASSALLSNLYYDVVQVIFINKDLLSQKDSFA